jgi:hypothetical protein
VARSRFRSCARSATKSRGDGHHNILRGLRQRDRENSFIHIPRSESIPAHLRPLGKMPGRAPTAAKHDAGRYCLEELRNVPAIVELAVTGSARSPARSPAFVERCEGRCGRGSPLRREGAQRIRQPGSKTTHRWISGYAGAVDQRRCLRAIAAHWAQVEHGGTPCRLVSIIGAALCDEQVSFVLPGRRGII